MEKAAGNPATITIIRTTTNKTIGAYKARDWKEMHRNVETEPYFDWLYYFDGNELVKMTTTKLKTIKDANEV
jgi:hypothetical protein